MSIYDLEANGRGRYDLSTFLGWAKISAGPRKLWLFNAERQWVEEGQPDREQDPSNPYWSLGTYKTIVCARTVAELERLIESARWSGWAYGYRGCSRPTKYRSYYVCWSHKRTAKAVDNMRARLSTVLAHVKSEYERTGYLPTGMGTDGKFMGYRSAGESQQADEVIVALAAMEFIGGFGDE